MPPRSNVEWIDWGKRDPLCGVATWLGRERGSAEAWTDDAFYAVGEQDWGYFFTRWEAFGVDTSSCVEIGCGAGRFTKPISNAFRRVHAVDISVDMVEYAKRHVDLERVTFYVNEGLTLPLADQSVGAAFSTHVFQHFDSIAIARGYIVELSRVLVPGATIMIHIPFHEFPIWRKSLYSFMNMQYDATKMIGRIRANINRMMILRGRTRPMMRLLSYDLLWIKSTLSDLAFFDVEAAIVTSPANGEMMHFVFARKR
ncbi:MAG: hypothetical protein QOF33_892 [Thermomicrobiales bacterium]|jgi:ubiquinone/menaquinone biosynthesis C-methylase UbiE|nr:hypothetical protein [Thermomicrobiales bacterium]